MTYTQEASAVTRSSKLSPRWCQGGSQATLLQLTIHKSICQCYGCLLCQFRIVAVIQDVAQDLPPHRLITRGLRKVAAASVTARLRVNSKFLLVESTGKPKQPMLPCK